MSRSGPRTAQCTQADARGRLRQADAFIEVAELVLADDSEDTHPGVAAALAVLAGIAAADAACCHKLRKRARGQSHRQALDLIKAVEPHGTAMERLLRTLLTRKDQAHYGVHLLGGKDARSMVSAARRLVDLAGEVLKS
jgi:hypothetical protein